MKKKIVCFILFRYERTTTAPPPTTTKKWLFPDPSQLLTMDVIELTLLLKSIGFRLESIDYDELRCWNGKKFGENGNGASTAMPTPTSASSIRTDAADQHYINVEISCSKSKIVSNLSLKFNDGEAAAALTDAPSAQHPMTHPLQTIACSCPKRETRNTNNSFWEIQSSGTFSNQRRSINSLMVSCTKTDSCLFIPALSISLRRCFAVGIVAHS